MKQYIWATFDGAGKMAYFSLNRDFSYEHNYKVFLNSLLLEITWKLYGPLIVLN